MHSMAEFAALDGNCMLKGTKPRSVDRDFPEPRTRSISSGGTAREPRQGHRATLHYPDHANACAALCLPGIRRCGANRPRLPQPVGLQGKRVHLQGIGQEAQRAVTREAERVFKGDCVAAMTAIVLHVRKIETGRPRPSTVSGMMAVCGYRLPKCQFRRSSSFTAIGVG